MLTHRHHVSDIKHLERWLRKHDLEDAASVHWVAALHAEHQVELDSLAAFDLALTKRGMALSFSNDEVSAIYMHTERAIAISNVGISCASSKMLLVRFACMQITPSCARILLLGTVIP